jgi:hypothetical protein
MSRRKPGRPRKTIEEKRERKTATQRYRREEKRMAGEQGDAIYYFHMVESEFGDPPRDRDSAGEHESR